MPENGFSLNGFGVGILFMGRETFTSFQESEEWHVCNAKRTASGPEAPLF
jgi:hypothetical protein